MHAIKYACLCSYNLDNHARIKVDGNKKITHFWMIIFLVSMNYFFLPAKSATAGRIATTPPKIAKIAATTQPAPK